MNEASENQLNLTVVGLVALVAIVGLVALVMNADKVSAVAGDVRAQPANAVGAATAPADAGEPANVVGRAVAWDG